MNAMSKPPLLPVGVHEGVPASQYHAMPAFSASGCKTIIEECPLIYRHQADNPEDDDGSPAAWMGTACHTLALEPELWDRTVTVIAAGDFKTKAAQAARDEALADGRVPLLEHQAEVVAAMNRMLRSEVGDLFVGGQRESTYVWTDRATGVPMKARPDYRKPGQIIDFKTTGSAAPRDFQKRIQDNQHHLQAGLYVEAHEILARETPDWLWVVQATKPPYPVSIFRPTAAALYIGQAKARYAINLYARCLAENRWPGYTPSVMSLDLPGWARRDFEEREQAGEFAGKGPINVDFAIFTAAQAPIGD